MSPFLSHILLTFAWTTLTGVFTIENIMVGFVAATLVLLLVQRGIRMRGYLNRLRHLGAFILFFLVELISASLRVAFDVLTPRHRMRPGILAIPLESDTDDQILALATLVSLTPGTLCLDISDDRRTMYVHAMYIHDADALRKKIKDGYERRVREVFR